MLDRPRQLGPAGGPVQLVHQQLGRLPALALVQARVLLDAAQLVSELLERLRNVQTSATSATKVAMMHSGPLSTAAFDVHSLLAPIMLLLPLNHMNHATLLFQHLTLPGVCLEISSRLSTVVTFKNIDEAYGRLIDGMARCAATITVAWIMLRSTDLLVLGADLDGYFAAHLVREVLQDVLLEPAHQDGALQDLVQLFHVAGTPARPHKPVSTSMLLSVALLHISSACGSGAIPSPTPSIIPNS